MYERSMLTLRSWGSGGTVPEAEISEKAKAFFRKTGGPVLCAIKDSFITTYVPFSPELHYVIDRKGRYLIPGRNGSLKPGERLYNWCWYRHYAADSKEFADAMTDCDGIMHHFSLPLGKVRSDRWEKQKAIAAEVLESNVAELVLKTGQPFIQAITDLISPKAAFWNGKVLIAGDALVTLRPMSGLGMSQGAKSALDLVDVLEDKMSIEDWEEKRLDFATKSRELGIAREALFKMGNGKDRGQL